jgi:soluble lytic murein transglycosylase-like protein
MTDQFAELDNYNPDPFSELDNYDPTPKTKGGFINAATNVAGSTLSGTGHVLKDIGLESVGNSAIAKGKEIQDNNPAAVNSFSDIAKNPGTWVAESAGGMAGQAGEALAGGVVGGYLGGGLGALTGPLAPVAIPALSAAGAYVGGNIPMLVQEYGSERDQQIKNGIDDKKRALAGAAATTAIENLGGFKPGGMAGQGKKIVSDLAGKTTKEAVKTLVKKGVKSGVSEGLEEIPQQYTGAYGGGTDIKDLNTTENAQDAAFGAAMAFPGGAMFGSVNTVSDHYKAKRNEALDQTASTGPLGNALASGGLANTDTFNPADGSIIDSTAVDIAANSHASSYDQLFQQAENNYGLPAGLLSTMGFHESGFDPNAVSPVGARGVMQFMPATAQEYGIDPHDTPAAINAAGKKMAGLVKYYNGDMAKAVAAYNYGEGNLNNAIAKAGDNWQSALPTETQDYLSRILGGQQSTSANNNTNTQSDATQLDPSLNTLVADDQLQGTPNPDNVINNSADAAYSLQLENLNGGQESTSETQNANAQEEGLLNTVASEQSGATLPISQDKQKTKSWFDMTEEEKLDNMGFNNPQNKDESAKDWADRKRLAIDKVEVKNKKAAGILAEHKAKAKFGAMLGMSEEHAIESDLSSRDMFDRLTPDQKIQHRSEALEDFNNQHQALIEGSALNLQASLPDEKSASEQLGATSLVDNVQNDPLVSVIDRNTGTAFHVLQSDLESDKDRLTKHSVTTGKRLLTPILRQDIVDEQTYQQELADQQQRQDEQANQQTETQAQDQTSADQSTAVTFQPTHTLEDGTPVVSHGIGEGFWNDKEGNGHLSFDAKPISNVDTSTDVAPSDATAPLLNKRTNKPFTTQKLAEAAIASSSNPTVNQQDHIAVPVDGGFGIVPKPNTTQGNNDTATETQSVLSNTITNATGVTASASNDVAGQASNATAQEVASQNTKVELPQKLYEAPVKSLGASVKDFVQSKVSEATTFTESNGKFYIGGTTGAGLKQVTKAVHTYGKAYQKHLTAAYDAQDKIDATAQATENVAPAQEFGNLSNNDQAKIPQVAQPTLMKRNVELHTVNGTVVKGDRYLFPGNERHPIIITKPSGNKGAATKQNHVAWDEISGSAIYMEPPKVYKDKPSAQHVIDVVSIQFNSGFGNKLDGHESRIQIKAPVQETANPIHDTADVSKKGENVDTLPLSDDTIETWMQRAYQKTPEEVSQILKSANVTGGQSQGKFSGGDISLSSDTNTEILAKEFQGATVGLKDTNGHRAQISIRKFNELKKEQGFTDRLRSVMFYIGGGEETHHKEFMDGILDLKHNKKIESANSQPIQQENIEPIEGISFENNSSVASLKMPLFQDILKNETIRSLLKSLGVTKVSIEPPYKFGLGEQANVDTKLKKIMISADATDPSQTVLHELGHLKYEKLTEAQKEEFKQNILSSNLKNRREAVAGYINLGKWEEVFADDFSFEHSNNPEKSRAESAKFISDYGPNNNAKVTVKDNATATKKLTTKGTVVADKAESNIQDLGEKIGGARKDTSNKTGPTGVKKAVDDRPTWAKRFSITELTQVGGLVQADDGKWIIRDSKSKDWRGQARTLATFDTEQEAKDALPLLAVAIKHRVTTGSKDENGDYNYEIWRNINERKRVKVVDKSFKTREEAMQYMAQNAQAILETNTTFGESDLPVPENKQRTGKAHRDGDVNGESFMHTFGIRGVEFGNWNNQDERQEVMNAAYDGLMDLSEVLSIPPTAIGLNGELALAFGARGAGLSSAKAHYELQKSVINLTKMNGAGALAHEWLHALDHYLGRLDGKADANWVVAADGTRSFKITTAEDSFVSSGFKKRNSGVREELRDAFKHVMETIFHKAETYISDTKQADNFVARTKEGLANELDRLRKDLSQQKDIQYYKRNNKPASAEQLIEFDTVASQLLNGDALETQFVLNEKQTRRLGMAGRQTNEQLDKLSAIYKAVRGRSGFDATNQNGVMDRIRQSMRLYDQRLQQLAFANSTEEKIKKVPTSFAMDAKELDQGRGGDYWTTAHEMAARAFQGYVEDKMAEQAGRNPFLNYAPANFKMATPWGGKRVFPHGEERKAINAAFDKFVAILETKETDKGTALFSKSTTPVVNPHSKTSLNQAVTKAMDTLFGQGWTNRLMATGKFKVISRDEAVQIAGSTAANAKGFFNSDTDITYLVYDNIEQDVSSKALVGLMLHEISTHALNLGKSSEAFQDILRRFEALKETNPKVQAAFDKVPASTPDEHIVEEALAEYLAENPKSSLAQRIVEWFRQAVRALGKALPVLERAKFSQWANKLTEAELIGMATSALKSAPDSLQFDNVGRNREGIKLSGDNKKRLAPNGKPSNLNAMQWAQVRTEAFKKWFGDWETVARQIHLREFINKALADKQWQERTVIAEGDNADPSGKLSDIFGFKVTKQVSAPDDIRKTDKRHGEGNERKHDQIGLTVDDYIKAIEILRNPESYKKTISNNGKPSAEFGRKFIDGTIVVAEVETAEDGTVAIKSVWKKTPGRIHADGTIYPNRTSENTAEVLNSISSNELIVKLDTVSKVVDENGEPLVVYHGTMGKKFYTFDMDYGYSSRTGPKGTVSFAQNKEFADVRGIRTIEAYINSKTPFDYRNEDHVRKAINYFKQYNEDMGYGPNISSYEEGLREGRYQTLEFDIPLKWYKDNGFDGVYMREAPMHTSLNINVFNPNQIKSATENNGDFSESNNNIKFSRSTPSNTPADNSAIRDMFKKVKDNPSLEWLGQLFTRNQLIEFIASKVPKMMDYKKLSQKKDNALHEREQKIAEQYEAMNDLIRSAATDSKKLPGFRTDYAKARRLMNELSRAQSLATNLDTDFDPADHVDKDFMTKEEREAFDAYDVLPDELKSVYKTMRKDYRDDMDETRKALLANLDRFPIDSKAKAAIVAEINAHFDQALSKGVYFPLARFGNIIVTGTNPQGEFVSAFVKGNTARDKMITDMEAQGYTKVHSQEKEEYDADLIKGNVAHTMAALAKNTVDDIRAKMQQGQAVEDDIDQMLADFHQELIRALPDTAYRKHFLHRKGTLGESGDTLRAYANTRTSSAKNQFALIYDYQIAKVLTDSKQEIAKLRSTTMQSTDFLDSVMKEIGKREQALKANDIAAWAQLATSLGFMGALGYNIASAGVNMLQVVGIGLPELSGRHGFGKSSAAITHAYQLILNRAVLNKHSGFDLMKNPAIKQLTKAALQHLHDIGKIDLTMTHDSIAASKNPSYSSNQVNRAVGVLAKKSGYLFHVAEALNRQVMGIAAFELELAKNGGDYQAALIYAEDVIDNTQYDYGPGNRARFMMGDTARVITLFKAYAIQTSWFIGRNAYQWFKGLKPEERLAARKTLLITMAMSFATAGLFGMPIGTEAFAGVGGVAGFKYKGAKGAIAGAAGGVGASMLASAAIQALLVGLGADDDDDIETQFRNWLTDNLNQSWAEFVTKGLARFLVPGDIAGRTGLSHLWYQPQNKELEGRDKFNQVANTLMGPVASQAANLVAAQTLWADGEQGRAIEMMSPRALANMLAAYRMAEKGVTTLKGDKIIQRDLTDLELLSKAIGFNPSVITNAYDANSAIAKESTKHTLAKSHLVNRWMSGDATERSDLMKGAIKDFNESVPPSERITLKSLFKSMRSRKGIDKHTKNGLYLSKKQNYLRDIGRFNRQE